MENIHNYSTANVKLLFFFPKQSPLIFDPKNDLKSILWLPFQIKLLSSSKIFSQTLTFQHSLQVTGVHCLVHRWLICLWQWRAFLNPINMNDTYSPKN